VRISGIAGIGKDTEKTFKVSIGEIWLGKGCADKMITRNPAYARWRIANLPSKRQSATDCPEPSQIDRW
jgi:hypothetical protein